MEGVFILIIVWFGDFYVNVVVGDIMVWCYFILCICELFVVMVC